MLRVALPKGRLLEESLEFFRRLGIEFQKNVEKSRKLIHTSVDGSVQIMVIRAKDVPTFVQYGGCDMGIVGRDILLEESADVYEMLDLGYGYCRLVVAVPEETDEPYSRKRVIRVATKYPNITERFFTERGLQIEIIKLYGSIELAPVIGMSDAIVDLVSTGKTLKANRLREVETIVESTAWLVVNRIAFKRNHKEIKKFIEKIRD
ncbi:MAG: ATP phosphoribosyltransferase [Nitrospirae bacterium]|nr:ATP phosphoribosyltransferase [Nitrospirota bacterium]